MAWRHGSGSYGSYCWLATARPHVAAAWGPAPPVEPPPAPLPLPAVQSWKIWFEAGVQPTPEDSGPISGMTATCTGPNGIAASVEVSRGAVSRGRARR